MPFSYAQVCAKANGTKIVNFDGLSMTQDLSFAIQSGKAAYTVHCEQLRATQNFICGKKPLELMDLPYDLRYTILEHHIEEQTIRVFLKNGRTPIRLPEAARVGSQLRRECLLVALKKTVIEIHSGPGNAAFQAWLARVDLKSEDTTLKTGFDAVTSLRFPYFSRFPFKRPEITTNNDIGLCKKSQNLREVSLDFHRQELGDYDDQTGAWVRRSAAAFRANYQLDGLLGLLKLEKLSFVCYAPDENLVNLRKLMAWFKDEFQQRGRQVVVEHNGVAI